MAEAAFSEDGKYFSALSQDGRLRIWDTETNTLKQEYTPDLHLTAPPSCLQWLYMHAGVSPQKGRRKSVSEQEIPCIALGTPSGNILLYSITQAKVETVLVDEKNSEIKRNGVTCLEWQRDYGFYSCNKDSYVYEWELHSSSVRFKYNVSNDTKNKRGNHISAMKIVPHNHYQRTSAKFLITSSYQVHIWRLHDGNAEIIKSLGHNASAKALLKLTTINNGCWLVAGSQNERLLSFWDVTITKDHIPQMNGEEVIPNKRQRRKSTSQPVVVPTPTYNFILEDAPKLIDVNVKDEGNGVKLSLVAATRSGVVHYYGHMLNGASTKPIKPSVTIQVTTADACPLPLQCCLLTSSNILAAYNEGTALVFDRIEPDLKSKTQILIRGEKKPKKKNKSNDVNKVKSDKSQDVTYVEPMGGVSRKRPTPGGKVEVPMEARLANLALDFDRSKSAVSQNLTKLLMQGLHSKDMGIILTVLQKDDSAVANRTISNLPAEYIPQLLEQLSDMATRKTSQCAAVCTWTSAVLRFQSAWLLATANVSNCSHLTQLLAIFTHRRSHLCQLLNLRGRLQLTTAQRSNTNDNVQEQEPLLQYNDSTEDEDDEEMEAYQSASEHSWDEKAESESEAKADSDESEGD